ncbi:sodium-independent sulfate anion transporter isoform X2 [Cephus cinctus]|uniref:Sodium-independent sulfate anion transporter isoform X2 n=1 Tax=Cephus cinctus TaxID=211228 RepID=A0AAJ7FNZ4_CEPCN|nr:sodium-independent sulfate anion transporter isoform X2 [Cephus cinctus]
MEAQVHCKAPDCKAYTRRRFPILGWLPGYKKSWILQDMLAGITVGLTAIPQGIAYGIVAGLNPEYGLYAAFVSSFVYIIFGSCKNITIGPTAIMALMVRPLVDNYGPDIAVLICFLKGCIITLLGLFHLGFLLDFISLPVITGFTSGAAITIASAQFKPILGIRGSSSSFLDSIVSVFVNIGDIGIFDTLLGLGTVAALVLLKNLPGNRNGKFPLNVLWMVTLARNALVVVFGTVLAYVFYLNDMEPLILTGSMGQGLPPFSLPPFFTVFHDNYYSFHHLISGMGITLFTMPIISTIEHIAISKAFAMGKSLDATQEMLALGLCNIFGSFVRSMPVTGSFTRTAVNYASGVQTPLGGFFTGGLILLALGFLTSTFHFIPRATLAGVIICAMYYMLDFDTYKLLWRAKKSDFMIMSLTLLACVFLGLEFGIVIGILLSIIFLLFFSARPSIEIRVEQIEGHKIIHVIPKEAVAFPAAENLRSNVMQLVEFHQCSLLVDGRSLNRIDATVAKNLKLLAKDLSLANQQIEFINCNEEVTAILKTVAPELADKFKKSDDLC